MHAFHRVAVTRITIVEHQSMISVWKLDRLEWPALFRVVTAPLEISAAPNLPFKRKSSPLMEKFVFIFPFTLPVNSCLQLIRFITFIFTCFRAVLGSKSSMVSSNVLFQSVVPTVLQTIKLK